MCFFKLLLVSAHSRVTENLRKRPEAVVGARICELWEAMLQLTLDSLFLIPHLAVNTNIPVFVDNYIVCAVVQNTQVLQARRLHVPLLVQSKTSVILCGASRSFVTVFETHLNTM